MNAHMLLLALVTGSFMFIWEHDRSGSMAAPAPRLSDESFTRSTIDAPEQSDRAISSRAWKSGAMVPGSWTVVSENGATLRVTVERMLPVARNQVTHSSQADPAAHR